MLDVPVRWIRSPELPLTADPKSAKLPSVISALPGRKSTTNPSPLAERSLPFGARPPVNLPGIVMRETRFVHPDFPPASGLQPPASSLFHGSLGEVVYTAGLGLRRRS